MLQLLQSDSVSRVQSNCKRIGTRMHNAEATVPSGLSAFWFLFAPAFALDLSLSRLHLWHPPLHLVSKVGRRLTGNCFRALGQYLVPGRPTTRPAIRSPLLVHQMAVLGGPRMAHGAFPSGSATRCPTGRGHIGMAGGVAGSFFLTRPPCMYKKGGAVHLFYTQLSIYLPM